MTSPDRQPTARRKQSSLGRTQSGLGLGRILGVPVEISWFTLLILGMIAMNAYSASVRSQRSASVSLVIALAFVVGYAVSILIHELGHTIAAHRFKIGVIRIRLVAWGGLAELKQSPKTPMSAFVVAFAGPAGSALCAVSFWGLAGVLEVHNPDLAQPMTFLAVANLAMTVLNLLPGNPLDGGRVVAAVVWGATGRRSFGEQAVQVTGILAAGVMLVGGIAGMRGLIELPVEPLWGIYIAALLYMGSRSTGGDDDDKNAQPMALLASQRLSFSEPLVGRGAVAANVAQPFVALVPPAAEAGEVVAAFPGYGSVCIIDERSHPIGVADLGVVAHFLAEGALERSAEIGSVAAPVSLFGIATPSESAIDVELRRQSTPSGRCIVMQGGRPVALISESSIQAALGRIG